MAMGEEYNVVFGQGFKSTLSFSMSHETYREGESPIGDLV